MGSTMSIDDLRAILLACAGDDESAAGRGDFSDASFEELGYDSLVLIEMAATLKRDHGVSIPDDRLVVALTPHEMLDLINNRIEA
ncbi:MULTISPECIES: acyl carrier protein [unclassified Pseudofrankia]|uniref:acyl carrier protein n=1 Tax=unclassified Pseudofrankia TaxID=2994372 RepID=UPI0008DA2FD5|nr:MULTISPECIES: acyl carrier protein [unclassified Pseudofrankia]MDT3442573.1 acyl carrier protein [Pseudofrankia sp. BMG5.37]OHV71771.1 actinorhodin polyketide synthase [Pseudofrankia sp. BMG5.36]